MTISRTLRHLSTTALLVAALGCSGGGDTGFEQVADRPLSDFPQLDGTTPQDRAVFILAAVVSGELQIEGADADQSAALIDRMLNGVVGTAKAEEAWNYCSENTTASWVTQSLNGASGTHGSSLAGGREQGAVVEGADGSVPCVEATNSDRPADVYSVSSKGSPVTFLIDTVSAESTFDPAAYVTVTGLPEYPFSDSIGIGDDESSCEFDPLPPALRCPLFTVTPETDEVYLVIFAQGVGCNESEVGWYSLEAYSGGEPVETVQVEDDFEVALF